MITFNNNKNEPVNILVGDKVITVKENSSEKFEHNGTQLTFTVCEKEQKASIGARFLGVLALIFISFIMMIFEFDEILFSKIEKAITLPVKVKLTDIKGNATVVIDNSIMNFHFSAITANCCCEYNIVCDERLIKKQVKQFHKECFWTLFIPLTMLLVFAIFAVLTKNITAIGIAVILLGIMFYIWYYHHKKNQKTINNLLDKN